MDPFRKLLVQMQVIPVALAAGLLVMIIVVVTIVELLGRPVAAQVKMLAPNVPIVTAFMGGLSLALFLIAWIVPPLVERILIRRRLRGTVFAPDGVPPWDEVDPPWIERSDAKALYHLVNAYHSKTILRAALLEALGMLAGMAYLVEGHWVSFALMALALWWLVWSVPTRTKIHPWVAAEVERLRYQEPPPPGLSG